MSKTTEERMASLNSLSEHVAQKIKALENQKHTVEHAVVEANRLNEMVWAMEVQINKLNEGSRQATRTEELIDRVEKLAREVGGQLDSGMKARDAFSSDLARLEKDRGGLTDFVRAYTDKLPIERKEFEAFDQRVKALQTSVGEAEKGMEALAARDRLAASMGQRVDQLSKQMQGLTASADELQKKQTSLDGLQESLGQVDELAKRTAWQYDNLKQSRQDLDALRKDIQDFYKSHAAAVQLRDRLTADRGSLEAFLDRTTTFSAGLPELDSRMDAITSKLAIVDEGTQKAANLVSIADDLDRQMTRITSRGEIEALKSQVEGVGIDVTDARQKLEGVNALQKQLLPLTSQLASLKSEIEKVHARFVGAQQEEAALAEQEKRLAEMLAASRGHAAEAAERQKQTQGLAEEVARSAVVKDELLQELARVQGRQRDVSAQLDASEDQLKRLEAASKALDLCLTQAASTEKRI